MTKEIVHSIILVATVAIGFIFPHTYLAQFDLQIAAGLFVVFFIVKRAVGKAQDANASRLVESVIFTLIVLIVVNTTGGVTSPYFFLLFFLLFSLSLLLEPIISIILTMTLVLFYIFGLPLNQTFTSLLPVFSLAFFAPFAMFMGSEFIKNELLKNKSDHLRASLTKGKEETFLFLSLILKNHIKAASEAVENFNGDHELSQIRRSLNQMDKVIEQYEKDGEIPEIVDTTSKNES